MFHDPSACSFTAVLASHWQVFGLFDFPHGRPIDANVQKCPRTAALIAAHVPHHGAAGFSVLAPRTRIRPHAGYQGPFHRCRQKRAGVCHLSPRINTEISLGGGGTSG